MGSDSPGRANAGLVTVAERAICAGESARDSRAPGGDLAIAKLSAAEIASFVRVMPVHLSRADVAAEVAD